MTGAREAILERLRRAHAPLPPQSASRYAPPIMGDLISTFIAKAVAGHAEVHEIAAGESAPQAILAILQRLRAEPRLHIAKGSQLWALPWQNAQLALTDDAPAADDAALSAADYAIAETGTLVFLSGPARPASWHFLPLREFALVSRANILTAFEDVIAALGSPPATLNLVTGPSRTGDIEQAMELGAHGPREVHILLAP